MGRGRIRNGGSGQQEISGRRSVVHRAAHEIPRLWEPLPLIQQNGPLSLQQAVWIGSRDLKLGWVVQSVNRSRTLQRRARLPDACWSFERNRCQAADQLIELIVDNAPLVRMSACCHRGLRYQVGSLKVTISAATA